MPEETAGLLALMVPFFTWMTGVFLSVLPERATIYREQYIFPALGSLALFFAIEVKSCKKPFLIVLGTFLLFVGAVQYREVFWQEYQSTYLNETRDYFDEHVGEDDLMVYNWTIYGFIYEYVFREYEPTDIVNIDWEENNKNIWFLNNAGEPVPDGDYFREHYEMTFVGHYGIEHSEFDLYRIEKKE